MDHAVCGAPLLLLAHEPADRRVTLRMLMRLWIRPAGWIRGLTTRDSCVMLNCG